MKKYIKKYIPNFIKIPLRKMFYKPVFNYYCPVCETGVSHFNRIGDWAFEGLENSLFPYSVFCFEMPSLFNYSCPNCGVANRNRLYAIYLNEKFKTFDKTKKYKFLDITPNIELSNWIKKYNFLEYRSCDLFTDFADDKVDIQDMKIYKDNSFDFLLCSHVLEHVDDDKKSMRELYRIIKPRGWGIVMVPILLTIDNIYENPQITEENERWKHFGQGDHVRLYSKNGFIERLSNVGFKVIQFDVNYFGQDTFEKSGIPQRSVLYVVEK